MSDAGLAERVVTACVLIIGNEILSGRVQDANLAFLATGLNDVGVRLREARVVPDDAATIVATVNEVRAKFDYVFTTGGIGPTHDDITADAVAKAFGVGIGYHPDVYAMLEARYPPGEFNDMRKRMARIPDGASLVANPISAAPGFHLGNVFVLAGVPMVMRAMLEQIAPQLPHGLTVKSITVEGNVPEGIIAPGLAQLQKERPDVSIGSYPFYREGQPQPFGAQLVLRSRDSEALEQTARAQVISQPRHNRPLSRQRLS